MSSDPLTMSGPVNPLTR